MEKVDAPKLAVDSRNLLRQMVLRLRKQSGMPAKELALVAGVHLSTVKGWIAKAKKEGESSLNERPRGRPVGSCRKLTMTDEMWLREQIVGQNPRQLKLPFTLWTRPAIRALIQERFGFEMQDRLIGKYLKRWGYTPQRPIKRALEQRPEEVAIWLKESYPALVARAKAEGAVIHWGDETAVKEDGNWVRGYAPKGKTPVMKTPSRWDKLSMISSISPRGEVAFQIVEGSINAERFIEFLAALIEQAPCKIILIVDNLRVHHAKIVQAWLADKTAQIELAYLPPYCPESNPDEYLNRDFKTALRTGPISHNKASLLEKALPFMNRLTQLPEKVAAYFRPFCHLRRVVYSRAGSIRREI